MIACVSVVKSIEQQVLELYHAVLCSNCVSLSVSR